MAKYRLYLSNKEKFNLPNAKIIFYNTASNINLARKKALFVRECAETLHHDTDWKYMHIFTENGMYVGLVTINKSSDHRPIWIPVKGAVAFIDEKGRIY